MYQQRHLTNSVIMVRPDDFGFNEQTGTDNEFQHRPDSSEEIKNITIQAIREFEQMVNLLREAGVEVLILDNPELANPVPDAIFPNNWFSTRVDGSLFIYSMKTINRQAEVQLAELRMHLERHQYHIEQVIDLRKNVATDQTAKAMEGTGSLVFHHPTATIFAAISDRCDKTALRDYATEYQYDVFSFTSQSQIGLPIYHTNVLMSCGDNFAVVADNILVRDADSKLAMTRLEESVKDVIRITEQQMTESFCGNILQLINDKSEPLILMSESAKKGFSNQQIKILEQHGRFVICDIPTIEYIGGGSVRCMMAENFLQKKISHL